MAVYFVCAAGNPTPNAITPSDSNDGRDPIGLSLSTNTFTVSGGLVTITATNAFSALLTASQVSAPGANRPALWLVYISSWNGATGGVAGLFRVYSVTDASTLILAAWTDSDAVGAGTIPSTSGTNCVSSTGPYATLEKLEGASGVLVASDTAMICGGQTPETMTLTATINSKTVTVTRTAYPLEMATRQALAKTGRNASLTTQIRRRGCYWGGGPITDANTMALVRPTTGETVATNGFISYTVQAAATAGSNKDVGTWENIGFTAKDSGGTRHHYRAFDCEAGANSYMEHTFINCGFFGAADNNNYCGGTVQTQGNSYVGCIFADNYGAGIYTFNGVANGATRACSQIINCFSMANLTGANSLRDGIGIRIVSSFGVRVTGCKIAVNAATGIQVDASGYTDTSSVVGNTVWACNKGIDTSAVTGTGDTRVDVNLNSVSQCAVYNYVLSGAAYANRYMGLNHSFHSTSTKHADLGTHIFTDITGYLNVNGDPLFNSPETGDFTPRTGSPLLTHPTGIRIGALAAAAGTTTSTARWPRW